MIAGHIDGRLRIYARDDGTVPGETNTLREYETVSGGIGRGGSCGGKQLVTDDMLCVNSGYAIIFTCPVTSYWYSVLPARLHAVTAA